MRLFQCRATFRLPFFLASLRAFPSRCGIARKRFIQVKSFALLGDDIVIGDAEVARVYRDVMNRLGVKISLAKTLTSDCGGL